MDILSASFTKDDSADNVWLLSGVVNNQTVPDLLPQGEKIIREFAASELIIDLSGVTPDQVDSSAVALLLACLRTAKGCGKYCKFKNIPAKMKDIMTVSYIDFL